MNLTYYSWTSLIKFHIIIVIEALFVAAAVVVVVIVQNKDKVNRQ